MATLRIEAGKILLDDNIDENCGGHYYNLQFKNAYVDPIVIVYILTEAGSEPVDVRVSNVESTGCRIFMQEYDNDCHNNEWVSYLVVDSGVVEFPDGTKLEAGKITIPPTSLHSAGENPSSTGKYETITFQQSFTSNPSFFTTLNTYNNNDFMCVGCKDVSTTTAKIFQERSRAPQTASTEVAGWIAIEQGKTGTIGTIKYETGRSSDGTNDGKPDNAHVVTYVNTYSEPPLFFAKGVTLNDTQGYWTRGVYWGLNQSNIDAEEPDDGSNLSHSDETFSHLIFEKPFDLIYIPGVGIVESERRRNLWVVEPYVYKAGIEGLSVFDLGSEALVNFIGFPYGATSVWANDQHVYIGTSISGVYRCPVNTVSGAGAEFYRYKSYPDITADEVNYVHGAGDYICVATVSGADRYEISTDTREYTEVNNVTKCFQTDSGDYYFVANPFSNIVGLDYNLFAWKYGRKVILSSPIPEDNYSLYFEIPLDWPYEIYKYAAINGEDLRIIDDKGYSVPYYIQSWNLVTPPEIWVKFSAGVSEFYIIYGGDEVTARSSAEDTFRLFDDFNGSTLSGKWNFDNRGNPNNTYTVSDGKLTIKCYDNQTIWFTSVESFYGGVLEYYVRRTDTSNLGDLDYQVEFVGGIFSYIGIGWISNHETPHRVSCSAGSLQGDKPMLTSFRQHTLIESENYHASEYDGELLEIHGPTNMGYRTVRFGMHDNQYQPDIEIQWIRLRNYDPTPPTCTFETHTSIINLFETTRLYAMYNSGEHYIYSSSQYGIINSSYINDIHVTQGTSSHDGANVIFLATSWGAIVLEEKRGDEENCTKRVYLLDT